MKLTKAFNVEFSETNQNNGWAFGRPVGIKTVQWPRSRINGVPMAHLWTFLVPEEYRVKGNEYVAISLFQACDGDCVDEGEVEMDDVLNVIDNKERKEESEAQEFWDSLLEYAENRHSQEVYLDDILGSGWVLIWLTEEEFNGESTNLPNEETSIYPDYDTSECMDCFENDAPAEYVQLVEREDDPNTGRPLEDWPDEEDESAYIGMYSDKGKELKLQEKFWGKTHFGGTANPVQATPAFSPFYIEFEEGFGDANMGGGNGQIDLLNSELNWNC